MANLRVIDGSGPIREDSLEQERTIVGACMVAPEVWPQCEQLQPTDFVHPAERMVFAALQSAARGGVPFDLVAIAGVLATSGEALPGSNAAYLSDLMLGVLQVETLPWHVGRVLLRSRARRLQADLLTSSKLDPDDAARACELAVKRYHDRAATTQGFETVRAADVQDPGPTRWLIEGLWISGGVGFIAGEPKTKKSFLTLSAAIAVASGRKLLQRFQARQAPVVLFNAEDRQSETARRLRRLCVAEGVRFDSLPIELINVTGLRLDRADDMRKLSATVRRINPGLVVLDPFRNLFDGDEDKSEAVSAALSPLRQLQREHECAVMVVHHMTKPNELKRRAGQRMRGSGALHGWGDCNLYVDLKGDVSAVEVEQRYADACEPFGWQLRDQSTPDGEALWCEPCAIPSQKQSSEQEQAAHATNEALVLRVIRGASEPLNAGRIAQQLQMRRSDVFAALNVLNETNAIEQVNRQIVDKLGRSRPVSGWVQKGASYAD